MPWEVSRLDYSWHVFHRLGFLTFYLYILRFGNLYASFQEKDTMSMIIKVFAKENCNRFELMIV